MSTNGESPKKIVNLSTERMKNTGPSNLIPAHKAIADFMGIEDRFGPPPNLRELSLSEAHTFAGEIVAKYSDHDTFMKEYIAEQYRDHPLGEERAARELPKDMLDKQSDLEANSTEGLRQILSYLKADPNYFPVAFNFLAAQVFLSRFPDKPQE